MATLSPLRPDSAQRSLSEPVDDTNPANHPYQFLLVEDHPLFAEGFAGAIQRLFPQASLHTADCGARAVQCLRRRVYDLVFLDLNLPDMSGFDVLQDLRRQRIVQPVVVLTGAVAPKVVELSRRFGALGAFSKRVDLQRLQRHCHALLNGEPVFENEPLLLSNAEGLAQEPTERELEVLMHLAEGLENARICQALGVSDSTLRTHLRNLFMKLDVANRTACVVKATRLGLI